MSYYALLFANELHEAFGARGIAGPSEAEREGAPPSPCDHAADPFPALQSHVPYKAAQVWLQFSLPQPRSCISTTSQVLDAILVFLGCSWGAED